MRKVALGLAMVFGLGLLGGSAQAESVCTGPDMSAQGGCAGVNEKGYVVVLDGYLGNPNPFDGYVGFTDDGVIACSENGGPYSHPDPSTQHQPEDCPFV